MSGFIPVSLKSREAIGKEGCGKLRNSGFIPAVFYGPGLPGAQSVAIDEKEFLLSLRHAHWETIRLDVTLPDGSKEMAMVRDLQRHPLTDRIIHVDLYRLTQDHKVRVSVPVRVVGKEGCAGVKLGGIFELVHHEIEMDVLPREIPDEIVLDVTKLAKGQSIHVKDIPLPESAVLHIAESEVVAMVVEPRGETTAAEAGPASMEVEVVKKGKKEEAK